MNAVTAPLNKLRRAINAPARDRSDLRKAVKEYLSALDSDYYNKDKPFDEYEDALIKIWFNRIELDELCEYLGCSMIQLIDRARVLQVTTQDCRANASDLELMDKMLRDGISVTDACNMLEVEPPEHTYIMTPAKRAAARDAYQKHLDQGDMFNENA